METNDIEILCKCCLRLAFSKHIAQLHLFFFLSFKNIPLAFCARHSRWVVGAVRQLLTMFERAIIHISNPGCTKYTICKNSTQHYAMKHIGDSKQSPVPKNIG